MKRKKKGNKKKEIHAVKLKQWYCKKIKITAYVKNKNEFKFIPIYIQKQYVYIFYYPIIFLYVRFQQRKI